MTLCVWRVRGVDLCILGLRVIRLVVSKQLGGRKQSSANTRAWLGQ